ncbi:MAG: TetR family transcriptional regulator C-terminal domain-containing protein [Alphaproteobacteria bacterium]
MNEINSGRASRTKKRTRIQALNRTRILDAALEIFSGQGFRGATVDRIAEAAGMSKPNLLYYFGRKKEIYLAVLRRTLEMWLAPLEAIRADSDPETEIRRYITRKLEFSKTHPAASRLFLNEIIQGAPMLGEVLQTRLRDLVEEKAAIFGKWAAAGKIEPVDPYHLIFMLWAMTQHYADFEAQIDAVLPGGREALFGKAGEVVPAILLRGVLPR